MHAGSVTNRSQYAVALADRSYSSGTCALWGTPGAPKAECPKIGNNEFVNGTNDRIYVIILSQCSTGYR